MASTSSLPQPDQFAVPISATPNFKNTQNNPVPDVVKNNSVPIEPSARAPLFFPQPEPNYYFKRILTKNVKNEKIKSIGDNYHATIYIAVMKYFSTDFSETSMVVDSSDDEDDTDVKKTGDDPDVIDLTGAGPSVPPIPVHPVPIPTSIFIGTPGASGAVLPVAPPLDEDFDQLLPELKFHDYRVAGNDFTITWKALRKHNNGVPVWMKIPYMIKLFYNFKKTFKENLEAGPTLDDVASAGVKRVKIGMTASGGPLKRNGQYLKEDKDWEYNLGFNFKNIKLHYIEWGGEEPEEKTDNVGWNHLTDIEQKFMAEFVESSLHEIWREKGYMESTVKLWDVEQMMKEAFLARHLENEDSQGLFDTLRYKHMNGKPKKNPLVKGYVPREKFVKENFREYIYHNAHDLPHQLWQTLKDYAQTGTEVKIYDEKKLHLKVDETGYTLDKKRVLNQKQYKRFFKILRVRGGKKPRPDDLTSANTQVVLKYIQWNYKQEKGNFVYETAGLKAKAQYTACNARVAKNKRKLLLH